MTTAPRIALLHATPVAMEPVHSAFGEIWPEAELVNLLDDSLTLDRIREPELTERMIRRFVAFGRYGHEIGSDAILVTCSAFGPAVERLAETLPIPVLKPNEAMFKAAVARGTNIAMVATFGPSLPTMEAEFEEYVSETSSPAQLTSILVEPAMAALRNGDAETHNRLIAERAPELAGFDAVMLAHFSTSRAEPMLSRALEIPVLSPANAAVRELRARVEGQG